MQAPGLFDTQDERGKYGLVHNIGLGGAVVVSLLRRPEFFKEGGADGRQRYILKSLGKCASDRSSGWDTTMRTSVDQLRAKTSTK